MSRLFLHCALCGRRQADGLLSRGAWGHLDVGDGRMLSACPTCKVQYRDWEERVRVTITTRTDSGRRVGDVYF
jgi:hypothetical protein